MKKLTTGNTVYFLHYNKITKGKVTAMALCSTNDKITKVDYFIFFKDLIKGEMVVQKIHESTLFLSLTDLITSLTDEFIRRESKGRKL